VFAVAITSLAKHWGSISLFIRYVKLFFAFYSLFNISTLFPQLRWPSVQLTQAMLHRERRANWANHSPILD